MIGVNSKGESTLINRSEIILVPLGLIGIEYLPILIELEYFSDEEREQQFVEAKMVDYLKTPADNRTEYANELLHNLWYLNWFLSRKYDVFGMISKGFATNSSIKHEISYSKLYERLAVAFLNWQNNGRVIEQYSDMLHNHSDDWFDSQLITVQSGLFAKLPTLLFNRIYGLNNIEGIISIEMVTDGLLESDLLIICQCAAEFMVLAGGYDSSVFINDREFDSRIFNKSLV